MSNEPRLYNVMSKPSIVLIKINHAILFGFFYLKKKKTMYTVYNDWRSVGSCQEVDKHRPISFPLQFHIPLTLWSEILDDIVFI